MDKDNRKYRFCFIDYMWYVAEKWSEREHNNLNGRMLLFLCWLFAITIPLGIPLLFRLFSWIIVHAKLLQKSEMRKDIVIELSYKGFG